VKILFDLRKLMVKDSMHETSHRLITILTNLNCQAEKYGARLFRVSASVDMRLNDFFKYMDHAQDERPLYLFDKDFCAKCPEESGARARSAETRVAAPSILPLCSSNSSQLAQAC